MTDQAGWNSKAARFREYLMRQCDDEPTWTEDEEWQAINVMSRAFAAESSGVATVVLPHNVHNTKNHWTGEFEALKANPNVHKVVAFDMKDCSAEPQGQPRELWPKTRTKPRMLANWFDPLKKSGAGLSLYIRKCDGDFDHDHLPVLKKYPFCIIMIRETNRFTGIILF